MKTLEFYVVWVLFFACSIFGHVALKQAAGISDRFEWSKVLGLWKDPWAMSAGFSWVISCFLWALLLTRYSVGQASSHSALRYILILVVAYFWFGESFSQRQAIGVVLIGAGIWLTSGS